MTILPRKISIFLFAAFGFLPHIWVIGIMWLAIRARFYLGYWPRPSQPDPKLLPFELHHAALWGVFEGLKWSLVILPLLYLWNRFVLKNKLDRWIWGGVISGWVIIWGMILLPGINFVEWFLD